jgi:IS605 OrfB family transposase
MLDEDGEINGDTKIVLKTVRSQNAIDRDQHKIIDYFGMHSKIVHNSFIFNANIFDIFNKEIYYELFDMYSVEYLKLHSLKNNHIEHIKKTKLLGKQFCALLVDKEQEYIEKRKKYIEEIRITLNLEIRNIFKKYRKFYSDNLNFIKDMNNKLWTIFRTINENTPIINSNYCQYSDHIYLKQLIKNTIGKGDINKISNTLLEFVISQTIYIVNYFYSKNYRLVKHQIINKIQVSLKDEIFIEDVKNERWLIKPKIYYNYKKEIKELLEIEIDSWKNLISAITFDNLNETKNILPVDVIQKICHKTYEGYLSYIALREKGIKSNKPNYLGKNEKYIVPFSASSRKLVEINGISYMRYNVGSYISEHYIEITKNQKLEMIKSNQKSKKYINKKYVFNKIKKGDAKKYLRTINGGYVKKNHKEMIDGNYMYVQLPTPLKDKQLCVIQFVPIYCGHKYSICYSYKTEPNPKIEYDKKDTSNYVFVDTGIVNLLTCVDFSGQTQNILSGGQLTSMNHHYNELIDKYKSISKTINKKDTTKRIRNLLIERENKINDYIEKVCQWILKMYPNKKCIVFGYNVGWKKEVNMGRKMNRTFYGIPYKKIINVMRERLTKKGIDVKETEESYTSKCDGLALEKICKHEKYLGIRGPIFGKVKKRGLFSSSKSKLINSDINGALNIGRKYMSKMGTEISEAKIKAIKGLFNPYKQRNL